MAPESEAPVEEAPAPEAPAETPAPTARHAEIVDGLRSLLGNGFVEHYYSAHDAWVRVAAGAWQEAARQAKERFGLTYFCCLSAIDWKQAPDMGAQKVWDPGADPTPPPGDGPGRWVTGVAGGETRFQVFARFYDVTRHVGVTIKADIGDTDPRVDSLVPVFRGADWHERETWEMFGVEFKGHPGLRHLYLPGEFEGYPLRKDFPLLAREVKPWPGLVDVEGLPGEDEPTESGSEEAAEQA